MRPLAAAALFVSALTCAAAVAVWVAPSRCAHAKDAPTSRAVEYRDGDVVLEGYVAHPAGAGARPGVLVVHDWMGPSAFTRDVCDRLAALGYSAFAADVYGKGVRPANGQEAGRQAGTYKGDRALARRRMRAAYDTFLKEPGVDARRIAVMGYCFGGTMALELARSGAPLAACLSFHGGLATPTPADAKAIRAKVLVMHGADDPNVPPAEVAGFQDEMRGAGVDYVLVQYGGAVHAFTNKAAGHDPSKGAAYDERADRRSWSEMRTFLGEAFGG